MTTQQDSVDVERLYEKLREIERFVSLMMPNVPLHVRRNNEAEMVKIAGYFADLRAALTLPITQRDEQAKTFNDGIADAVKVVDDKARHIRSKLRKSEWLDVITTGVADTVSDIATAIRRLSIKQGDQDGGEG